MSEGPPEWLLPIQNSAASNAHDEFAEPAPPEADGRCEPPCTQTTDATPEDGSLNFEEEESAPGRRGRSFLLTASAPKKFPATLEERRDAKKLLPEDLGREGVLAVLRDCFGAANEVTAAVCVMEEHERRSPLAPHAKMQHIHVAAKVCQNFAHKAMARRILNYKSADGELRGFHCHFSMGPFEEKVLYLLVPSDRKPRVDPSPIFFGEAFPDMFSVADEDADQPRSVKKRRRKMAKSVLTDFILDGGLRSVADVQNCAKKEYLAGTPEGRAFYDYVMGRANLQREVDDIFTTFGFHQSGSAIIAPGESFSLSTFNWERYTALRTWVTSGYKEEALVIYGEAGTGKTRLSIALLQHVVQGNIAFVRSCEQLRDAPRTWRGVVFDEFASTVRSWCDHGKEDSLKHLLDAEMACCLPCRNEDCNVPASTPRIIVLQHSLEDVAPRVHSRDMKAIVRRCTQVHVTASLRR